MTDQISINNVSARISAKRSREFPPPPSQCPSMPKVDARSLFESTLSLSPDSIGKIRSVELRVERIRLVYASLPARPHVPYVLAIPSSMFRRIPRSLPFNVQEQGGFRPPSSATIERGQVHRTRSPLQLVPSIFTQISFTHIRKIDRFPRCDSHRPRI